jgi:TetR/AcrR family transcriptional repressor of nem operon
MKPKPKPPAKKRDLKLTRQEILGAAFLLVLEHGFQGVSIDDIVKKTSLTKGALFHQFPTKLDLGYALVDEVIRPLIIQRWIEPLEGLADPLQGILDRIEALIGTCPASILRWGCPLNNLVQEMTPLDPVFRKKLQSALAFWVSEIERHLLRAKAAGLLKKGIDTKEAAYFIVMAHEGFYGMMKGLGKPVAYQALLNSLKIYFEAISHARP